jgi:hypothetical protein
MKRILIVSGLLLAATPTIAEARCEVRDFLGRWDVYGIANSYNEFVQEDEDGVEDGIVAETEVFNHGTTLDCVIQANRRARLSRSFCVERSQLGGAIRIGLRGEAEIKGNCTIEWELEFIDRQTCLLEGTMTRNKEMVSGVANCDGGTVSLFNVVRR